MNALKHGCDAAPENEAAVMRALGEDPQRYAALQRELATTYGPGDALCDHQVADLGKLYWRRNRLDRMETGLMRRALQAVEERKRTRRDQIAAATFDATSSLVTDLKLPEPTDPCARLRQLLSRVEGIRERLNRERVTGMKQLVIRQFLAPGRGWRPVRIDELMGIFIEWIDLKENKDEQAFNDFVNQEMGGAVNVDILWRELLRLLDEEIVALKAAFEEEVKVQEENDEIERDACLAPEGETWEMLTRQEAALDRSIDRKVRIILTMRREHARLGRGGSRTAQPEASPPGDETGDRAAEELSKVVGLDAAAEVAPNFSSAGADPSLGSEHALKASATNDGTESPAEENGGETSKSPEQSQGVIENKGSAAEGVKA